MDRPEALHRMRSAPVGRLATLTPSGGPHLVAVTYAVIDGAVAHIIDHKPKTTSRLQRLVNIEANPAVSFLVDHYDDDWDRLWWVRIDGRGSVLTHGPRWERAREALVSKYPQYRSMPPQGPAVLVSMDRITWWEASSR